jgi:hypothetical protein
MLTFAASNEHIEPTCLLFGYIENIFGVSGLFVFFGMTPALIYLGIATSILRRDIADTLQDALKVALASYILILALWSYIFFNFKPE